MQCRIKSTQAVRSRGALLVAFGLIWLYSIIWQQRLLDHVAKNQSSILALFDVTHNGTSWRKSNAPNDVPTSHDENNLKMPNWMERYLQWHRQVRQDLNATNWNKYRYLVYRCCKNDMNCGGMADRLRSIPLALRLANDAGRLLFIVWTRPARLEEFLIPPAAGLDWRLPDWLAAKLEFDSRAKCSLENHFHHWINMTDPVVRMENMRQSHDYYEERRQPTEPSYEDVFKLVWNIVFQPAAEIQNRIDRTMQQLQLRPGNYVAAHVRARYAKDKVENHEETNALACAAHSVARPLDIFIASDSKETIQYALQLARQQQQEEQKGVFGQRIVARTDTLTAPLLHLDRGADFLSKNNDWQKYVPADFYDLFVDFYLLASSKCVAYGIGGFGKMASWLSANRHCSINHRKRDCQANLLFS